MTISTDFFRFTAGYLCFAYSSFLRFSFRFNQLAYPISGWVAVGLIFEQPSGSLITPVRALFCCGTMTVL